MALARSRRNESGFNYWPGFVDALSTLVLSIVFLLSVFLVVQFFLSQEVTGKDKALEQLNAKLAQLNDLLSLEKLTGLQLNDQLSQARAGLASVEAERDRIKGLYDGLAGAGSNAEGRANELNKAMEAEKKVSSRALAQIEVLNQQISALRRQLAALEEALEASEKRDKESQGRIADLGQRLNVALAQRVQELSRYRSEFFGRLRAILGNRPDIRIVGDRFVFQSEVFFDTGQALLLPEGRAELDQLATALIDLDKQIPAEIAWVLRVDGHTDVRPINSPLFKSNWELSSARAISVVQYLISLGVPAQRLVAAGFAEFQPLDTAATEDAYKRNRRIELVQNAAIIVAEQAGTLIGFVTIDLKGYLDQLVVSPTYWGSELGNALLDEAKRLSPDRITLLVNTDNARAIRFYERNGFAKAGGDVNPTSGRPVLRMEWKP